MLVESSLLLLKNNLFYIFLFPLWLLQGKAYTKRQIAQRVTLDVSSLPYHSELVGFLTEEYRGGRQLFLTTASDTKIAQEIAGHVGIFSGVFASDGKNNLSGRKKLQVLENKFGRKGFDYAGNTERDLKIWIQANEAIVVNASHSLVKKAQKIVSVGRVFDYQKKRLSVFLKAIRIHQWVKNSLLFIPLLGAHEFTNGLLLLQASYAFLSFSLCASSGYVLNDLVDLEADRLDSKKRDRPFASGDLSPLIGVGLIPLLLVSSLAISVLLLPKDFLLILSLYFVLTVAYSLFLREILLVDVVLLAILYTIRIFSGGITTGIHISQWLSAFSMFLFLSLALVKRFSELNRLRLANKTFANSRSYSTGDLGQLANMGSASGYIAVLVLALYINSKEVAVLYRRPDLLWLLCPLLLYWISRIWVLADRGLMDEDPVVFALKDKVSFLIGVLTAIVVLSAV